MSKDPYMLVIDKIVEWCDSDGYFTDIVVFLLLDKYESFITTLNYDGMAHDFCFSDDWWEGQKSVRLLGFIPVIDIQLTYIHGRAHLDGNENLVTFGPEGLEIMEENT